MDRLLVQHLTGDGEIRLCSLRVMRASLVNQLICKLTTKVLLNDLLLRGSLDQSFELVHEHIEEFIHVHLNEYVRGIAIPILELLAEACWVNILRFGVLESGKDELELIE